MPETEHEEAATPTWHWTLAALGALFLACSITYALSLMTLDTATWIMLYALVGLAVAYAFLAQLYWSSHNSGTPPTKEAFWVQAGFMLIIGAFWPFVTFALTCYVLTGEPFRRAPRPAEEPEEDADSPTPSAVEDDPRLWVAEKEMPYA